MAATLFFLQIFAFLGQMQRFFRGSLHSAKIFLGRKMQRNAKILQKLQRFFGQISQVDMVKKLQKSVSVSPRFARRTPIFCLFDPRSARKKAYHTCSAIEFIQQLFHLATIPLKRPNQGFSPTGLCPK